MSPVNWNAAQTLEPLRTCAICGRRFRQDEPGLCPECEDRALEVASKGAGE